MKEFLVVLFRRGLDCVETVSARRAAGCSAVHRDSGVGVSLLRTLVIWGQWLIRGHAVTSLLAGTRRRQRRLHRGLNAGTAGSYAEGGLCLCGQGSPSLGESGRSAGFLTFKPGFLDESLVIPGLRGLCEE